MELNSKRSETPHSQRKPTPPLCSRLPVLPLGPLPCLRPIALFPHSPSSDSSLSFFSFPILFLLFTRVPLGLECSPSLFVCLAVCLHTYGICGFERGMSLLVHVVVVDVRTGLAVRVARFHGHGRCCGRLMLRSPLISTIATASVSSLREEGECVTARLLVLFGFSS